MPNQNNRKKITLSVEQTKLILHTISNLAKQGNYDLSRHATIDRLNQRHFTMEMVENILLNPKRIIRAEQDLKTKDIIFKIEGGSKNRKLAVSIVGNMIFVLTVM